MNDEPDNRPTLSAYIITLNEEKNIARALESVRWMDEIVVLDSGSTDDTVRIAGEYGAKVTVSEFRGYVTQKNNAMELCSGEWLFNLDADEEVTKDLRTSIERVVAGTANGKSLYRVSRKTWYFGRWIEHCGWNPEYRVRLSRCGKARWAGEVLHESLTGDGPVGLLDGYLLHRPYHDLGEHLTTIGRYTYLWARREASGGRTASVFDIVFRPPAKFLKMYILRGGIRDGVPGFVASVMGAWYTFLKYARLIEYSGMHE